MKRRPHEYCRGQGLRLTALGCAAVVLSTTAPTSAQAQQANDQPGYSIDLSTPVRRQALAADTDSTGGGQQKPGNIAKSSVGTVGQRQEKTQGLANIKPMARLDTRIANRVQSRIRNRIDRFYDPQANAISPFEVAADQARAASSRAR